MGYLNTSIGDSGTNAQVGNRRNERVKNGIQEGEQRRARNQVGGCAHSIDRNQDLKRSSNE